MELNFRPSRNLLFDTHTNGGGSGQYSASRIWPGEVWVRKRRGWWCEGILSRAGWGGKLSSWKFISGFNMRLR
jgi:hypothetical protein